MRVPLVAVFSIAVLGAAVASCGGGGGKGGGGAGGTAQTASPVGSTGPGSIIVTRAASIGAYDLSTGRGSALIKPESAGDTLVDPAVSRDGSRIAYVVLAPPERNFDAGSDLWVANRDGSGQRLVYKHDTPNQQVRLPRWSDGDHVLAVVQEPAVKNGFSTFVFTLERIAMADGTREKLADNILAFDLSPDGAHGVYAQTSANTGETLATGDAAGGNLTTIIGLDQNLQPFNSPRYSPDGSTIAFASAYQTGATTDQRYVSARRLDAPLRTPLLDGLPEDLWIVDAKGGKARRVATLKEDLPTLAWSGDGRHIYVLGANATYDVNLINGNASKLGEGSFHGQITWAP
jgi:Tol biopolymer transport system component